MKFCPLSTKHEKCNKTRNKNTYTHTHIRPVFFAVHIVSHYCVSFQEMHNIEYIQCTYTYVWIGWCILQHVVQFPLKNWHVNGIILMIVNQKFRYVFGILKGMPVYVCAKNKIEQVRKRKMKNRRWYWWLCPVSMRFVVVVVKIQLNENCILIFMWRICVPMTKHSIVTVRLFAMLAAAANWWH